MYLQITTRCNMTCAHCCFSADHSGSDMSRETLMAALDLAEQYGHMLTVGGGEPTVHPQFFEFLGLAMAYNPEPSWRVLVVTNGKRKDMAMRLAAMAREGLVRADLSLDDYHDLISPQVIQAFTPARSNASNGYSSTSFQDFRGIRSVERIVPVGRAVKENVATENEGCCCESLLVDPEGRIFACGCKSIQLGTVFEPNIPANYNSEWAHSEDAQTWLADSEAALVA